jgi:hypothetical protein
MSLLIAVKQSSINQLCWSMIEYTSESIKSIWSFSVFYQLMEITIDRCQVGNFDCVFNGRLSCFRNEGGIEQQELSQEKYR